MSFPQPTEPVVMPLTLEGLAERVASLEFRMDAVAEILTKEWRMPKRVSPDAEAARFNSENAEILNSLEIKRENERLTIENAEFSAEVQRLGGILVKLSRQTVPDVPITPTLAEFGASD